MKPELSGSDFGFCGRPRWGLPFRRGRRKTHLCFFNAPGVPIPPSSDRLWRGVFVSGAFSDYLSGPAAVERAGGRKCGGPGGRQTSASLYANRQNRSIQVKITCHSYAALTIAVMFSVGVSRGQAQPALRASIPTLRHPLE